MQTHLEENVKVHLNKVSCRTKQQESQISVLQLKTEQQQQEIVALMSALTQVALDVQKPLVPVFVPPPDIVMTDFEKHKKAANEWFSPPFYSHIGGYKMCLGVVANGDGNGKATHVSVYFYLLRGEHDDQLKWPFRGDITIQLLNQSRGEGHGVTVRFSDTADDDVTGRVVGGREPTMAGANPNS